jgi:uncharacterized protein YutE (UPF0331/DUF86 family)
MPRHRSMLRFRSRVVRGYLGIDDGQLFDMMGGQNLLDIQTVLERFEAAATHSLDHGRERGPGVP